MDLVRTLQGLGIHGLEPEGFITSAMAAARFVATLRPGGSAHVIGGAGLATELHQVGYSLTESDPDDVVVGKTASFSFPMLKKAAALIDGGATFISRPGPRTVARFGFSGAVERLQEYVAADPSWDAYLE